MIHKLTHRCSYTVLIHHPGTHQVRFWSYRCCFDDVVQQTITIGIAGHARMNRKYFSQALKWEPRWMNSSHLDTLGLLLRGILLKNGIYTRSKIGMDHWSAGWVIATCQLHHYPILCKITAYKMQLALGDEIADRGIGMEMHMWEVKDKCGGRKYLCKLAMGGKDSHCYTCLIECTVERPYGVHAARICVHLHACTSQLRGRSVNQTTGSLHAAPIFLSVLHSTLFQPRAFSYSR